MASERKYARDFKNIIPVLWFFFCASMVRAIPGTEEEVPQETLKSETVSVALLVLPSSDNRDNKRWKKIFEEMPQLRLTVALSRRDFSHFASTRATLMELQAKHRLEAALRLPGDPPIPLIYDSEMSKIFLPSGHTFPESAINWPEDIIGQIVRGKMDFGALCGSSPKGFVPGGGSLNLPVAEYLKKQKFSWTIGGFPEEEWSGGDALLLHGDPSKPFVVFSAHPASRLLYGKIVPLENLKIALADAVRKILDNLDETGRENRTTPVIVFDEQHSKFPLYDFLYQFAEGVKARGNVRMVLCSEAAQESLAGMSASLQLWPYSWSWIEGAGSPRGPGLSAWMGDEKKNEAWDILSRTRADIERCKNSGRADLEKLDRVMDEFYLAESGDIFEWLASGGVNGAGEISGALLKKQRDKEMVFRNILAGIYRNLALPLPDFLQSMDIPKPAQEQEEKDLSRAQEGTAGEQASRETTMEKQDRKFIKLGLDSILWNEPGAEALSNEAPGKGMEEPSLKKFLVQISSDASKGWIQYGFMFSDWAGQPVTLDLYIDINHRQGAGDTSLLPGRSAIVGAEEGWEFVLSSKWSAPKGWECQLLKANNPRPLFRTTGNSGAMQAALESNSVIVGDKKSGFFLSVKVPKNLIGEHPFMWGYLAYLAHEEKNVVIDFLSSDENKAGILSVIKTAGSAKTNEAQPLLSMMRLRSK